MCQNSQTGTCELYWVMMFALYMQRTDIKRHHCLSPSVKTHDSPKIHSFNLLHLWFSVTVNHAKRDIFFWHSLKIVVIRDNIFRHLNKCTGHFIRSTFACNCKPAYLIQFSQRTNSLSGLQ